MLARPPRQGARRHHNAAKGPLPSFQPHGYQAIQTLLRITTPIHEERLTTCLAFFEWIANSIEFPSSQRRTSAASLDEANELDSVRAATSWAP
ncbi:hypothetical protein IG631_18720 [Alternaria alternata]|nr:hypothetical protein IG631_18720 [Alternaria alternata]